MAYSPMIVVVLKDFNRVAIFNNKKYKSFVVN